MEVTLANPTALDATAAVQFTAADGQLAQPYKVDWGDGTVSQMAGGSVLATHTYAKAGHYKIEVASNNVTLKQSLTVGHPGIPAPGATVRRTQEVIREDTAALLGTTSKLG